MSSRRARVIAAWSVCIAAAAFVVVHARYITDLSAFLPARPTPMQRLLVDQLREGPGSRLILIALEHGDAKTRAEISIALAHRLRLDREFSSVNNGEQTDRGARSRVLVPESLLLYRPSTASTLPWTG